MTDEKLVELFQSGDKAAGEELLINYKNKVLKVARRFFLYGGETEDLVQEGMCGLYSAMTSFSKENAEFSTYAYACIRNRILDAVKVSSNNKNQALNNFLPIAEEGGLLYGGDDPEETLIKSEEKSEFRSIIKENLSPFEYKVISRYLNGESMAEISAVLDKSYKAIDNALMRAKRKLQKILIKGN